MQIRGCTRLRCDVDGPFVSDPCGGNGLGFYDVLTSDPIDVLVGESLLLNVDNGFSADGWSVKIGCRSMLLLERHNLCALEFLYMGNVVVEIEDIFGPSHRISDKD